MGWPKRIDFAGAWHHVMNRGAGKQIVFRRDADCVLFMSILETVVTRYRLEVHGYALMPNHYHLLVRSLDGRLSSGMALLNGLFTRRLNGRIGTDGPRFRGRFRNRLILDDDYLRTTLCYLHLNPVKAHLTSRPDEDCWTSHRAYMGLDARPPWLRCDAMLSVFGDEHVLDGEMRELHQGSVPWPPGLPLETEYLWKLMGTQEALGRLRTRAVPPPDRETAEPDEIFAWVAELTGVSRESLMERRYGPRANPARRFAVWVLSTDTALNQREVGRLMNMSANQVSLVLSRLRKRRSPDIDSWMATWERRRDDAGGKPRK